MSLSLFKDVATLYEKSASATIARHRLEHPSLGKFCVSLNSFYSRLDELANEDYWLKFLIPLKRLRFGLCAAPFSREYRFERISTIASELQHHLRFCSKLYPDLAEQAIAILDLLTDVLNDPRDPLLYKLSELTDGEQRVAWVIKESRLIPHVEELVAGLNFPRLNVIHPLQLKDLTCYDHLIVIGPSRWFPESVFTASRASQIDILIFDWIKDWWKPQGVFVSPYKSSGSSNRKYATVEEHETSSHWDEVDAGSLLDIVDKVSSVAASLDSEGQGEYENIEAACVFLEDDWAVFIEASEGATTLVIDPDEDTDNRISRTLIRNIQPGMFVLVRTSGSGDYIVPIADKIMGDLAGKAREYQKHWKELLRNYIRTRGLFETCIDLLDLGSEIASEVNVRNWMSPRSIRTKNRKDFVAIMELVGLKSEAGEYWNMMSQINKAHLKAGFEIRDILLDQVRDLNMEILQKQGKMDFKLSDGDEGGLTAFRIESVLKETVQVPYSRIGQPFKLEDQLWRE